jgi:hypothetical protein
MAWLTAIERRRRWALALAAAAAAVAIWRLLWSRRPVQMTEGPSDPLWTDQAIDEALDDSFPASDPPSWSSVSGSHPRA